MIHRPHPITGLWPLSDDGLVYDDPPDALLWDACERCEQHAADPFSGLDVARFAGMYRLMLAVERDVIAGPDHVAPRYRTAAEARACRPLYQLAVWVERTQPRIDPWAWPWALRARAGVR